MGSGAVPYGRSSLYLATGVTFLQEEEAVFEGMLTGWRAQMVGGRGLRKEHARSVSLVVERFRSHSGEWPWTWTASHFDQWMLDLTTVKGLAPSTIRGYQGAVSSFCDYVTSEHYGWVSQCDERFGTHPIQVCHDWNTVRHLQDYEGRASRRPLTREELQRLFDRADAEIEDRLASGRKGALPAYRDAVVLRTMYGWGLRANEAAMLDVTDFYRNAAAPQFGEFGVLQVRHGKASRGGAPKRRSVITLRDWPVEAVKDYLTNVWPLMSRPGSNAMWLSERGTRLRPREIAARFAELRDDLGLERGLTPHCLRHSYVTHLVEEGVDTGFVQRQVGHRHQSTTSIYTAVSGDYANKMMQHALEQIDTNATTGGMER